MKYSFTTIAFCIFFMLSAPHDVKASSYKLDGDTLSIGFTPISIGYDNNNRSDMRPGGLKRMPQHTLPIIHLWPHTPPEWGDDAGDGGDCLARAGCTCCIPVGNECSDDRENGLCGAARMAFGKLCHQAAHHGCSLHRNHRLVRKCPKRFCSNKPNLPTPS